MRYIDYRITNITLPVGWPEKAENLKQRLILETDPVNRAKIIKDNQDVWKELKPELAKLSNHKCWYTDSPQQGTDVDVDHFRPKNRVAELRDKTPEHLGYWWLAFEPKNYRYSCIVANRRRLDIETDQIGGKADHFPIFDESKRAWIPTTDCDEEQPILLDPCKLADVRLLTFKDDGEVMPREKKDDKPKAFERAEVSIKYYNLNHSDFIRARIVLRDEINTLASSAKKYYDHLENGDAIHEHAFETTLQKLRNICDKGAPYSSFCMACLENFKHEDCFNGMFL